jgi:hypothetical protein
MLPGASARRLAGAFRENGYVFKDTPIPGSLAQVIGTHPNGSFLQIKGHGDAVATAGLMFAVEGVEMRDLGVATIAIATFMQELGWKGDGAIWAANHLKSGGKKTRNGVVYEVVSSRDLGVITLSANPVVAKKAAGGH